MDIKKLKKSRTRQKLLKTGPAKAIKKHAKSYISGGRNTVDTPPRRVTNDSMTKHRKEALSHAKKFKYPLKHSKQRIATISTGLVTVVLLIFSIFSYVLLYKQQDIGEFAYKISQILPVPVARVGGSWIRFERYLFEVRHNAHYLVQQENVSFSTPEGKKALTALKNAALTRVEDNEIVRQLAGKNNVKISNDEVDAELNAIREAGGIGTNGQTLEDTIRDFYGWNIKDLKRAIKSQMLKQRIVTVLDTDTRRKGEEALTLITTGKKTFEAVVKEYSQDDLTKDKNGIIGAISREDSNLPNNLVETAYALKDGNVSSLITTTFGVHIIKRIETTSDGKVKIAHVLIKWQNPEVFINQYRDGVEVKPFIDIE